MTTFNEMYYTQNVNCPAEDEHLLATLTLPSPLSLARLLPIYGEKWGGN